MSASPKPGHTVANPAPAAKPELMQSNYAAELQQLFMGAVERMAGMQKECLEVVAQHSAEMMDAYTRLTPKAPANPAAYGAAKQAFDSYVEIQKSMIDLLAERANALGNLAKECGDPSSFADELTTKVQESVDRVLAAHSKVVEISVQQMDAVREAIAELPESQQQWRQELLRRSARNTNAKD